jgi:outer membrane protein assembly factor BamB
MPVFSFLRKQLRLALSLVFSFSTCLAFAQDVTTYHNNNARTGLYKETTLTTSNVNSAGFGLLFNITLDGIVDAQPLYLSSVSIPGQGTRNVLYVVTENDSVYALDADTGVVLWQKSMLLTGEAPSDDHGCTQISPQIGITSTPVIDRSSGPNGTIYVVSMSKKSSSYFQRIHALDITTGAEQFSGPKTITAKYPGTGDNSQNGFVVFDPAQYAERSGLLLLNNVIYLAWTSHCDIRPYTGWIMGYDKSTLAQSYVLNVTPNGNEGAIWQAGAGMAADANNFYFLQANGTFDTTLNANGFPNKGDFGNAFMKIGLRNNKLRVVDYFNMFNTVQESNADQDLGSGGAMVLPGLKDSQGVTRQLAIGAGKDTNIYIVERNNMGKFDPNKNNIYQEIDGVLGGGIWSMPAYFNQSIYFGAVGNKLMQFKFTNAKLSTTPVSKSSRSFTYPGTTPAVSANGNSNGIVWAIEHGSPSTLHAYDATTLATELYNSNQAANSRDHFGIASKFGTPMVANGKVYVGTRTSVAAFGLLP